MVGKDFVCVLQQGSEIFGIICNVTLDYINNYVRTSSPVLGTSKFWPSVLEAIERSLKHECVLICLEKCWQIFYVFSPECSQML